MQFNNFDIFRQLFLDILDLSYAHTCRLVSVWILDNQTLASRQSNSPMCWGDRRNTIDIFLREPLHISDDSIVIKNLNNLLYYIQIPFWYFWSIVWGPDPYWPQQTFAVHTKCVDGFCEPVVSDHLRDAKSETVCIWKKSKMATMDTKLPPWYKM